MSKIHVNELPRDASGREQIDVRLDSALTDVDAAGITALIEFFKLLDRWDREAKSNAEGM